jgi:hypothetical protein
MTELEVQLTADIKKLKTELNKAKKEVQGFGVTVDAEANKASSGLNKTGKAASAAQPKLGGVTSAVTKLTQGLGSTGVALQAVAGSFLGPAGITLLAGAAAAGLALLAKNLFDTRTNSAKLAEVQKTLTESLEKYKETLIGVTKARLDGNRSASEELVSLRLLRSQIENTTLSLDQRRDGIAKLQKQFPNYFKNVSEEALLNGSLTSTYNTLTNAILKRARATAAQDLLVQNAKKEFSLQKQLEDVSKNIADADQKRGKDREKFQESTKQSQLRGINPAAQEYTKEISKANDLLKEQVKIQTQLGDIGKENLKLEKFVTDNIIVDPKELIIDSPKKINTEKFKNTFQNLDELFKIPDSVQKSLDPAFENFQVKFNRFGEIVQFALKDSVVKAKAEISILEQLFNEFADSTAQIFQNNLVNGLSGIGDAIGNALIQGGNVFSAVGQSIIQSMGRFLSEMGGKLIEYGTLAVAKGKIDLAILAGGPIAIGAGIAAIAVGVALKAAGAAFSSAGSGSFSGGGGGGSSSGRISGGGSNFGVSGSGGGTVVFEIAGTKLVGVLNRTLGQNKSLGGNLQLT